MTNQKHNPAVTQVMPGRQVHPEALERAKNAEARRNTRLRNFNSPGYAQQGATTVHAMSEPAETPAVMKKCNGGCH